MDGATDCWDCSHHRPSNYRLFYKLTPGLSPTAVSWGYPHLEVFALTQNTTKSVYRKTRDFDAVSESDFLPPGRGMSLVGGPVDTAIGPAVGVTLRRTYEPPRNLYWSRTEMHIYNGNDQGGIFKFHDNNVDHWTPWGPQPDVSKLSNPDIWEPLPPDVFLSAPALVNYERSLDIGKVFFISPSVTVGADVHYFQFTGETWHGSYYITGNKNPDLHQVRTPECLTLPNALPEVSHASVCVC